MVLVGNLTWCWVSTSHYGRWWSLTCFPNGEERSCPITMQSPRRMLPQTHLLFLKKVFEPHFRLSFCQIFPRLKKAPWQSEQIQAQSYPSPSFEDVITPCGYKLSSSKSDIADIFSRIVKAEELVNSIMFPLSFLTKWAIWDYYCVLDCHPCGRI